MTKAAPPRHAATVILVRPAPQNAFELFMTRRPAGMGFLGGMYVFPGGSVAREDWSEPSLARCHGLSRRKAQTILGGHLNPEICLGHWVAAVRELFEEVGILACVTEAGAPVEMKDEERGERLAEKRKALVEGSLPFHSLLESEGLLCDASRFGYFSHWLTAEIFPIRFDTRFYIASLPPDQTPLSTSEEVSHSLWLSPDRALKLFEGGELPMIFPTFASLRTLADFDSLESLAREYGLAL